MKRLKTICEFIGDCAFIALFVFFAWVYCKITPNQLSGEADRQYQEYENDAGEVYAPAFGREVR